MKKKVLSIVLALCLVVCLIPLMGAASGDATCPICGHSEYLTKLDGQFGYKTAQVGDAAKGHYAVYRCTSPECSQASSRGYWDDLAGDVIPHDYNKWGECTTCWYECTHSSADRIWHSENGQYWKECGACGREFAKNDIPVITLNAPDEICRTQDCSFTFNLPEGCVNPEFGYEFVSVGSGDSAAVDNGVCSGTVEAEWYAADEGSFTLTVYVTTSDGFTATASKVISVIDGHRGGKADCHTKAVCEICGQPYGDFDKENHVGGTELRGDKPATCTEDGYTGDTYCIGCGDVLVTGNVLPAEGHIGGTATTTERAVCEICGQPYGELLPAPEVDPTPTPEPTPEPAPSDKPADNDAPKTGDDSNVALWLALLVISGGAITLTVRSAKKSK